MSMAIEMKAQTETSLEYLPIPPGATRLTAVANSINTALPSESSTIPNVAPASSSNTSNNLLSSLIPQLLLASSGLSSVPTALPSPTSPTSPSKPRRSSSTTSFSFSHSQSTHGVSRPTLLSTKDPLSLPITTANFKRFVSRIGPVFWLQDRIEEVLMWKRGVRVTCVWMGVWAFFCYFPRLILLIPHFALIAIMLSTYPFPAAPPPLPLPTAAVPDSTVPASPSSPTASIHPPPPPPPASAAQHPTSAAEVGSVPWQANIQAIQNLMGAYADADALIAPYLMYLSLAPPLSTSPSASSLYQTHTSSLQMPLPPPLQTQLLALLILSLLPLLLLVTHPLFPMRTLCLILGWAPFVTTHPGLRAWLARWRASLVTGGDLEVEADGGATRYAKGSVGEVDLELVMKKVKGVVRRVVDDDRLSDACWGSSIRAGAGQEMGEADAQGMQEVELWENERFVGDTAQPDGGRLEGGWNKRNLKPGERSAWTRGRDGWSGLGVGDTGTGAGDVSHLTFPLTPGWAFVDTEDWRKDLVANWAGCGADSDGWVYTNEAWLEPRASPSRSTRTALALSSTLDSRGVERRASTGVDVAVTRRRRWVRRIWYAGQ